MANRGGQIGNKNAQRAKVWYDAIKRALSRNSGSVEAGLDKIADKIVSFAVQGESWAIEHIADRLDGKPKQTIDGKLEVEHTVNTGDAESLGARLRRRAQERAAEPTVQ